MFSNASIDGLQISAQYLAPDEEVSAHVGFAVTPAGTSVGQAPDELQGGEQKSPPNH